LHLACSDVTFTSVRKTVVINAVGLTQRLISPVNTPRIDAFVRRGKIASVGAVLPAVTCSVQSTYLTGTWPSEHGIVGNGWYDRTDCEIKFWKQSNKLVQRPKVWDIAKQRDPSFTCANICWWYAMYSGADYTVTPRPMYLADGRKLPDCWTEPSDLRDTLQSQLGQFPLFKFWGPMTSIDSTRWIADAAMEVDRGFHPTLSLIYLPHLDYNFQRHGPNDSRCVQDLRELDEEVGKLIDYFRAEDATVILLSEYGIAPASRPVHINRVLRKFNLLSMREELGREHLDPGDSQAVAVADHQIAHVYVNDPAVLPLVLRELKNTPGIAHVYSGDARKIVNLDHERSGDVIAVAEPDAWFTYYYWLDDAKAPDFARTVDIHRKPGYDPAELFIDPKLKFAKLKIAKKLFARKLGFRNLLDVIPLDATLVKGSHGIAPRDPLDGAMLATSESSLLDADHIEPTDVMRLILAHLG